MNQKIRLQKLEQTINKKKEIVFCFDVLPFFVENDNYDDNNFYKNLVLEIDKANRVNGMNKD